MVCPFYVAIVGGVYEAFVVICMATAAPRCRVPTPKPRAKKLSTIGYGPMPGIWRSPWPNPAAPLFPGLGPPPDRAPDWFNPLRHSTFYQGVFKAAVARAGLTPPPTFHALRHTYASLCVAAGIPPLEISRFMGHDTVTTTLNTYAHLFESDHSVAMAALGAQAAPATATNVVPLRGRR